LRAIFVILITFFVSASIGSARQMECAYNHVVWKTTFYLTENSGPDGSIIYSFRRTDSGFDDYKFSGSTELQKGEVPLMKMWDKMYYSYDASGRDVPSLFFIDFSQAKMHEFQAPSAYMEQLKNGLKFSTEQSASLRVPIQIWNCKRID
jgi:hypothetical protein